MHEQREDSAPSPENVSPGAAEPMPSATEASAPPEPQAQTATTAVETSTVLTVIQTSGNRQNKR